MCKPDYVFETVPYDCRKSEFCVPRGKPGYDLLEVKVAAGAHGTAEGGSVLRGLVMAVWKKQCSCGCSKKPRWKKVLDILLKKR